MKLESENFILSKQGVYHVIKTWSHYEDDYLYFPMVESQLSELKNLITDYLQELDQCCKQDCGRCGDWEL